MFFNIYIVIMVGNFRRAQVIFLLLHMALTLKSVKACSYMTQIGVGIFRNPFLRQSTFVSHTVF